MRMFLHFMSVECSLENQRQMAHLMLRIVGHGRYHYSALGLQCSWCPVCVPSTQDLEFMSSCPCLWVAVIILCNKLSSVRVHACVLQVVGSAFSSV